MDKKYILHITARRGGTSWRTGQHGSCYANSDEEALKKLLGSAFEVKRWYDEIVCTIKCGNRVAHRYSIKDLPLEDKE